MLSVTAETFAREVEQASLDRPVVVDFWGPNCGPCLALAPVLERLEPEYAGRLKLVKVNVQEGVNQQLAQRLKFLGIPHLIAFVGGEPVRRLAGKKPEPELRAFFDGVLDAPQDAGALYLKGIQDLKAGDSTAGILALRAAIALQPGNDEARLALVEALERIPGLPEDSRLEEIARLLDACSGATTQGSGNFRYESLRLRWRCMRELPSLPAASALRERIAADSASLSDLMMLARRHIGEGTLEEAVGPLLECMRATVEQARSFIEANRELRLVLTLFGVGLDAQREQQKLLEKRAFSPPSPTI